MVSEKICGALASIHNVMKKKVLHEIEKHRVRVEKEVDEVNAEIEHLSKLISLQSISVNGLVCFSN